MSPGVKLALILLALMVLAAALAHAAYRSAARDAENTYRQLARPAATPTRRFDPAEVASLPEIARRYFGHAIAPGTPIYSGVELEMEGIFLLGDKGKAQTYTMSAREVLRPPAQFAWLPRLRSGALSITGSDAVVGDEAWTRFWLLGAVPVANAGSSPDLVRSARFRAAVEGALWLPSSLLPENRVAWQQVGPDTARVTLAGLEPHVVLHLTLDAQGAVREVVGERWSNANPEKRFRLQPFGGTAAADATFRGLTIPTSVAAGNHYGTDDYLPFFQAHITRAKYF